MGSLTDWESRQLEALLYQLDGMAGRIWLGDYGRQGTVPKGAPVVFGVGQSGSTLQTAGWTPSQKVLERGSYLQVGDEPHCKKDVHRQPVQEGERSKSCCISFGTHRWQSSLCTLQRNRQRDET
jgi:hypothetical protein